LKFALLVPGRIDQLTGGYLFARRVVDELRRRGHAINVVEMPGHFPDADVIARNAATAALAALHDDEVAVIDGLGLLAFADCLAHEAHRLQLIGWVHHPLADETGLSEIDAARFHAAETQLLPLFRGILCPSRVTGDAVIRDGVEADAVGIAPPGTDKPAILKQRQRASREVHLLSVATITPRKGHLLLVEALATLRRNDWTLDCIGSLDRDTEYAAALQAAIARHGLGDRIKLHGELAPAQLDPLYDAADMFVLPSFHEGYGMAFAEALAHGLPIIATQAGAIPDTVPESAGILVPPGDLPALAEALRFCLDNRAALLRFAQGAAQAGADLPDWRQAATRWHYEVARLLA
jgi:glycosyltransferase involved in cell wall biosynthesis